RITAIGCIVMMIFPFVYFGMLNSGVFGLIALAIILGLPSQDIQYGPQAAFIAERFPGRLRYSGASLGYQLASAVAGGLSPLIATALLHRTGASWPIALFVVGMAAVTTVSVFLASETAHSEINIESDVRDI
ncbi:MAG TPA: MFS transporter, partial [Blastocatellia bacterium]|nr:MFS transporter [Blastocatellia bacterium]